MTIIVPAASFTLLYIYCSFNERNFMTAIMLFVSLFTIVELNCENLFDYRHDTGKDDIEFTPEGNRKWTSFRYYKKINNIAKTLLACGNDGRIPDLIALCEVENDSVLTDLTHRSPLKGGAYDYIMTDSKDPRGIDVALIYCRLTFKPVEKRSIGIEGNFDDTPLRDILFVKGIITGGDTLNVMVVHSPSRRGGKKQSEPKRAAVINTICNVIDSITDKSPDASIIVTGDFNASSSELSLKKLARHGMTNSGIGKKGTYGAIGSYKYQGVWETIDHIFLSPRLNQRGTVFTLHDMPMLLEKDKRYGGVKPRRTFYGWRYDNEGCSDHLPISVTIRTDESRQ